MVGSAQAQNLGLNVSFRPGPRCDESMVWQKLEQIWRESGQAFDMRDAFAADPSRAASLTWQAAGLYVDASKQRWDPSIVQALMNMARECGLDAHRQALFEGQPINITEGRPVLHMALRHPQRWPSSRSIDGLDEVLSVRERMLDFVDAFRSAGTQFTDVVNIGIGGSDLGPQMVVRALASQTDKRFRFHFVSNVDAADLYEVLHHVKPESTLFIVASKTFTTQETLNNAQLAKDWFLSHGGCDVAQHFVGVTTNLKAAEAFGVKTTFGFWDWVGGRYSLWSSIGLPIALALGRDGFLQFLAGAHAMDEHFQHTPFEANVPVLLALLDVWNRNFVGCGSRSVAPYSQALHRLPAYLQQLEMESNGKSVDLSGCALKQATSPVVWGEPGTNGQHAFFQMIHQGTDLIPVEFILVKQPEHPDLQTHKKLLANGLAQAQALLMGKTSEQASLEKPPTASAEMGASTLSQHRRFSGNRPSTVIAIDRLSAFSLGALIALYEHRVFVAGSLWGINSYDQWGVELGKALCTDLLKTIDRLQEGESTLDKGLDASTSTLLQHLFL